MASLSSIVKNKPRPDNVTVAGVTADDIPPPPELKRQTAHYIEIDEDFDELQDVDLETDAKKYDCVCFIGDVALTNKIRKQIGQFKTVKEFDTAKFANRSLDELYEEHGIEYVWINLKKSDARDWIAKELPRKSKYFTCISVYSVSKHSKWLKDLDNYVHHTCKLSELQQQLVALSFKELAKNLDKIELHEVPNRLFACLGISKKISKKKN